MGLARKMKRQTEKPNIKEQKRQIAISAKANRLANDLNRQIAVDRRQAEILTFYKFSILANWILHDKHGFGKKRLLQFQDDMAKLCACIDDKGCGITVEGVGLQLKEETGFDTVYQLNNRRYNENAEVAV